MRASDPDPVSGEPPPNGGLSRLPRLLREWRLHHALKAANVATRLGVAPATWGHWETGKRFPSSENLVLVSRLTGIPIHDFFCSDVHDGPVGEPALKPNSKDPRVCCTCGAPLYQK